MSADKRLHQLDLNLLLPLDALLTERHVTRAAERLSLGQSGMSAALARLRKVFDDRLLVRNGRALELTPLGQALVDPVRDAVSSLERILSTTPHFDPARTARTFRVVASDYVILVLLRPLLERLYAEAPLVKVGVNPITTGYVTELERASIDLLIMPKEVTAVPAGQFAQRELYTDRYVCAVSRDNREVGDTITTRTLSELPYLTYNPNHLPAYVDVQLDAMGVPRNLALSTQSFVMAPLLLPGTPMLAFVHERLTTRREYEEVRVLEPPVPLEPITETMYWHPVFDRDPGHRWLRERLIALADDLDTPAAEAAPVITAGDD
ncbi:LysR family transcriptional regulator [Blastococcus sp. SYSU D00820]